MGIINVLDKHVAELIAAGEVVERPASVIKELIENSIDAGAKNITVEIKNGGTTFMRVADDGCGIMREDVKTAFLRHATSKVKLENDLDKISTLGFRGEALASICSVSRLQLITRNEHEDTGTSYRIEGGEEVSLDDAGCPVGTTFIIRDLFYNIPARAKFLKKDVAEGTAVANIVDKTALSHPEIAFTFIRDGKQTLKTFGDGKLSSAVYTVMGREFAGSLIPVDYKLEGVTVQGYITKPVHSRPNRNMQNFFVNGRYVKTRTAMYALEEAFKGSIMVGKFPCCVLNLTMPYDIIDVNVHPAKIEVRFINERIVYDAVYHAVKTSLKEFDTRKDVKFPTDNPLRGKTGFNPFYNAEAVINRKTDNRAVSSVPKKKIEKKDEFNPFEDIDFSDIKPASHVPGLASAFLADSSNPFDIISKDAVANAKKEDDFKKPKSDIFVYADSDTDKEPPVIDEQPLKAEEPAQADSAQPLLLSEDKDEIRYIGEAFNTYIIAEKNGKELIIIDKHAAHERMIYEELKASKAADISQLLLQPMAVTLGREEYRAAVGNLGMFADCAFEIEDFGDCTVLVRSAPQYLGIEDIADCVAEMADYIAKGRSDIRSEKMDWFYHNVACRSAIKGGNKNTPQELIDIVMKLENDKQIRYCPHGRPVCVVMKKSELEKQFGRV